MKNIKNIILVSALGGLSLASCNDLDTEILGSTITTEQKEQVIENDPAMIEASVTAITSLFSVYNQMGSGNHDDYGYPSQMLSMETRGQDVVSDDIGYNWYGFTLQLDDHSYDWRFTRQFWTVMYSQIYACNEVLKVIDPATEDSDLKFYLAQAYAIRAFDYFNLAQMYQFTYAVAQDKPCVPLILDSNAEDAAANGCPRATVQDTYNQIMSDLNNAITLLEASSKTRSDKRYVDAGVAYGLRARVNLVMNNWAEAASDAQKALNLNGATPYSIAEVSVPTFTSQDEHAWMWCIKISETDDVVQSGILNWPSHMGSLNYGYASVGAWRRINKALYNSIPATDVRKGWFLNEECTSPNLNAEQQAYVQAYAMVPYTHVKFGPYKGELGTSTNACDIPLMRAEEMYLIIAEAKGMQNASEGAAALESFVKTYRDPSYVCSATSPVAVQNAVWMQRRIELWGEGHSYFDLQRLQKPIDRRGGGYEAPLVYNVAADDPVRIYMIPLNEIQNNPQISEGQNNPIAGMPTPVEDIE